MIGWTPKDLLNQRQFLQLSLLPEYPEEAERYPNKSDVPHSDRFSQQRPSGIAAR